METDGTNRTVNAFSLKVLPDGKTIEGQSGSTSQPSPTTRSWLLVTLPLKPEVFPALERAGMEGHSTHFHVGCGMTRWRLTRV
jgi:hypothetical protein